MNPITLDNLLAVTSARTLNVTIDLSRTLTATVTVDSNDLGQWSELVELYGDYEVTELSPDGGALNITLSHIVPKRGGAA